MGGVKLKSFHLIKIRGRESINYKRTRYVAC